MNQLGTGDFTSPFSVAVDANSNVYVADKGSGEVKELMAAGGYTTLYQLASGINLPRSIAVDGSGNVFVSNLSDSSVTELPYSVPPSLTFSSQAVGTTSSPQTVTVANIGNAPLTFPVQTLNDTPTVPTNFTYDSSSTCALLTPASTTAATLAAGKSCTVAFDFAPLTAGSQSGNAVITDNSLNAVSPYALHGIWLTGTTPEVPTISLTSNSYQTVVGSTITLTATVSFTPTMNYGMAKLNTVTPTAPTGTVSFFNGSTNLGTAPLTNGTATFNVSTLPAGTDSLTAVYSGDSNFIPVTSAPLTELVQAKATPSIQLIANPNPAVVGTTITLSATVYSLTGSRPTGTVTFFNGSTILATATLSNGTASDVTGLPVGTYPSPWPTRATPTTPRGRARC